MISQNSPHKKHLRIGLFTDTFRPTTNGISVVVDTLRTHMEARGHEVFVVCSATRTAVPLLDSDDHILHVPSIKGWPYREYDISFFVPPRLRKRLLALNLDVIIFFTPGQLGLMAMDVARHANIPVIAQHSTDLPEYVTQYASGALAAVGVAVGLPFFAGFKVINRRALLAAIRPKFPITAWGRQMIEEGLAVWYGATDATIALSRKSKRQIEVMTPPRAKPYRIETIPVGLDALPLVGHSDFRQVHNIPAGAPMLMYVGRISREKNLATIIPMMERVLRVMPAAYFVFVGDFDYRPTLEAMAAKSRAAGHIVFVGKLPRVELGVAYAAADVFVFPSITDTQGLVLHEAAQAGLPIVAVDGEVTEVVKDGENGFISENTADALATGVLAILSDTKLRQRFAAHSKRIARRYSEAAQTDKLLAVMYDVIAQKSAKKQHDS
ncbi:MAG: glycosyltransferase [Candidatus Saccharibacteria bacterium]